MDVVDQLNAGVRSLDFRMIWTAPADKLSFHRHDWYVNHRIQSAQTALSYLTRIRDWMQQHTGEVVRMTISRHGDSVYPFTPLEALQGFYHNLTQLFGDLLVNRTAHPASTTPISELVASGSRMLITLSDYMNMTKGGSELVQDESLDIACCSVLPQWASLNASMEAAAQSCFAPADRKHLKELVVGSDPSQEVYATAIEIFFASPLKILDSKLIQKCVNQIGFSALSGKWCPASIKEFNWLQQYYAQFLFENALSQSLVFPNDIFVDDLGPGGTMQIGRGKGYALMDTVVLANVKRACATHEHPLCAEVKAALQQRRAVNPLQVWHDPDQGRQLVPPT